MPQLSNRVLDLVLLPTERCNFRCTYCYEDFELGRMRPEIVRGLKRWLARRAPGLDRLSLAWFGGEPLLAADLVEEVQAYARELASRFPRMDVHASMTTNGYLLDADRFARLVGLGVLQYQISLDGPGEVHDRRRRLAGGRGTFDRIWGNLVSIREAETSFEVIVRVHIDEDNRSEVRRFLEQYGEAFGHDRRFKLYLRPTSRFGGPGDDAICVLAGGSEGETIDPFRDTADRMGLAQLSSASFPVCYAARGNSFVVRSDGSLQKCTVALSDPANRVGRLLEDGRVRIDGRKVGPWIRGWFPVDAGALACPWAGLERTAEGAPVDTD